MFRKLILTLLALLTPFALYVPAHAQSGLLFGQKHYYSVTFRANQEAIVYARIILTNNTDKPLTTTTFTNGNAKIDELVALQMILPRVCEKYPTSYPMPVGAPSCEKYGDPDYTNAYSYSPDGEQTEYFVLKPDQQTDKFSVKLNKPIEPSKSGAIVLAYVSKDYVKSEAFDVKNFDFKTLGAETRQGDTVVSVDVDSGLTLKGAVENDYTYRPGIELSALSADTAGGTKSITNKTLDSTVTGIGSGGKKSETATGVAPGEQFSVKGSYAASSWKLYEKTVLLTVLISVGTTALLIFAIVMLIRRWLHGSKKHKTTA